MKTENLTKAQQAFDLFLSDLREAHKDAVQSGNQFAELAIFHFLDEMAAASRKLNRMVDAANANNAN